MNNNITTFSILAFTTLSMPSASVAANGHGLVDMPYYAEMPYTQKSNAQLHIASYSTAANVLGAKKDFRSRYAAIAKSQWFKKAYQGKSLGDIVEIDN